MRLFGRNRKPAWNGLSRFNAGSAGSRTIDARAIGTCVGLRANKARLNRVHWAGAARRRESPRPKQDYLGKTKTGRVGKFPEWTAAAGEMRHKVFVGQHADKKHQCFPRIAETARGRCLSPAVEISESAPARCLFTLTDD
jgi:hypothetical protein